MERKTYPITDEQRAYLDSFRCERLTADDSNRDKIRYFQNRKGSGLVNKLKYLAWAEDAIGSTAYYVIKDAFDEIVMFFSLKCGVLFDPHYIANNMALFSGHDYGKMWDAILKPEEAALPALQQLRDLNPANVLLHATTDIEIEALELLGDTLKYQRLIKVREKLEAGLNTYSGTKREKRIERNPNIIRVPESFSAIELVEFCANTNADFEWDEELMAQQSFGATMFWGVIVPKMLQINGLIGSEYVFLFAADHDLSPFDANEVVQDGEKLRLIQYYQGLHFEYSSELGTAKPYYDFSCQFMCQRLKSTKGPKGVLGMDYYMEEFFENFNEDPDARDYA